MMKEASVNYIRTSHYPREPRFYELADSLGFYIIDEVPFGFGDKNLRDSSFYEVLQQRAQATIRRDKNHASVMIWSLGNENPLTDICVKLGDYVKKELDASRPICYPQVFRWSYSEDRDTIAGGAFSPDCMPRHTTDYEIRLPRTPDNRKFGLFQLQIIDSQGRTILRQSIPVNPFDRVPRLLASLTQPTESPKGMIREGPLVRAGRKATMAEKLKVAQNRMERYLLRLSADGHSAGPIATDIQSKMEGNALHYTFSLTSDTSKTFLSELGLAFLLDPSIKYVQWLGKGVMPTYPGRFRAGQYGFWALREDDLYLEGNRMGVDAALLTDVEGNGLLLICRQGNVSFEQTDRGIVLTYNVAVSGQGPKFARTAFPVVANEVGTVHGDFYLYRVEAGKIPALLRQIFVRPRTIPSPFHPFETQYDTYLMRYGDIVSNYIEKT